MIDPKNPDAGKLLVQLIQEVSKQDANGNLIGEWSISHMFENELAFMHDDHPETEILFFGIRRIIPTPTPPPEELAPHIGLNGEPLDDDEHIL